jgi:NADPH:quinone reductase-like Zn-dependent oxidoreductase
VRHHAAPSDHIGDLAAEIATHHVLVESGKLRPHIARAFPLAEAAKAHAPGDTGHVAGKLVLTA